MWQVSAQEVLLPSEEGQPEVYQGQAQLKRGAVHMRCERLEIHKDPQGQWRQASLRGEVRLSVRGALLTARQGSWERPSLEVTLEEVEVWRQGTRLQAQRATVDLDSGEIRMQGASGVLGAAGGQIE